MSRIVINVPYKNHIAKIKYYESGLRNDPVILAVHGAPGSLDNFKEFAQSISTFGYRFICPEFPGYSNSKIDDSASYIDSTECRVELITSFINCLSISKILCVIGHSFGSAAALNLAANKSNILSAAFFNGMGLTPHRALRPFWAIRALAIVLSLPFTSKAVNLFLPNFINKRGFSVTDDQGLANAIKGFKTINFENIRKDSNILRESGKPVLLASSENDKIIEASIVRDYASYMAISQISTYDAQLQLQGLGKCLGSQLHMFERGGHMVHRAHHKFLAEILDHMLTPLL